ncbi:CHAT domain-containing protein [Streptomyces sp. NPDC012616]|uniref:CHAT domain-containing protein n=1 Tax=Streptomyces sp. NPDC012616 TaxID=3364840 RepID=UPI0036E9DC66
MNPDPALVELIDLWYELPVLVGEGWPELRPRLLTAVEELATAPPMEYERRALGLLRLLLGHAEVRKRLAPALIGKTIPTDRAADTEEGTGSRPARRLALRAGVLLPDDPPGPSGRWINAVAEPGDPGVPGAWVLAFDLADTPRDTAVAAPLGHMDEPDAWPVSLTVRVYSADAVVEPLSDTLTVPREGPSPDRARFRVTPLTAGTPQFHAVFLHGNTYVHSMLVNASEWAVRTSARGLSRTAVGRERDRGLSVHLWPAPDGHSYEIVVSGGIGHAYRAHLRKKDVDLDAVARDAREPLRMLATEWGPLAEGGAVTGLELSPDAYERYTTQLAEAGCRMFRALFFDRADAQLQAVGRKIQDYLAESAPRSVQFVTEQPLLPWHLMCPVEDIREADFRHILGLRHQVDCIPLCADAGGGVTEVAIDTRPGLGVTLGLNRSIDRDGERDLVRGQETYWRGYLDRGLARLAVHDQQNTVLKALRGDGDPAEILYLYCHAVAHDPEDGGPASARLAVEDAHGGIPLRTLHDYGGALPGLPIVVLNACGTAFTSASSTTSFLTYFLERSRGVLGTEADTPAPFAAAWATAFFDRFLSGEPMGEAVRATREHFAVGHRNPLGLLYALYCNGDTVLHPALATA